ncbi:MAG TPA: DUF4136 domain-containing protein [Nitrospira sp.]|nr:DUF4136 domain-containing protein [Nitrospira sp.]
MTRTAYLGLLLLTGAASACSSTKIGYDFAPGTNFSAYHTYEWMTDTQEKTGDRRLDLTDTDIRIRSAIAGQLLLKGYAKPSEGQPDFYVAYSIHVKTTTVDTSSQYFSDGMAGHAFVHSADTRTTGKPTAPVGSSESQTAGTFMLDIIDAASLTLVWRGTAAGAIAVGLTSRERDERVRAIAHDMLANFPPK